ncbi:hypothetical protein JKF63_05601 [Porcisia hertigi]|uniref:Vps72/YL1 N-terminal domain-containing protein n=1 Tax=Porcisia hertigi TaxID=2761500 RepID=A0A836IE12_9TRYP|nr:hypothetical protein JKF63_05601 [Porcisia hertigi]
MEWADDVNRPRRANAGNRLQELLANGLDEEEEKALQALSDASSDTSFTLGSDEEAMDEIESDFDAEEIGGTLEGEAVETEALVRRAERHERQLERQKKLRRSQNFSEMAARDRLQRLRSSKKLKKRQRSTKSGAVSENDDENGEEEDDEDGSDDAVDLRQRVRHRPAPTIPCSQRLAEAHARAAAFRAARTAAESPGDGSTEERNGKSTGSGDMLTHQGLGERKVQQRGRRPQYTRSTARRSGWATRGGLAAPVFVSPRIALYEGIQQRVGYSSGVSVLKRFRVPTVVSFSAALPPVLQP